MPIPFITDTFATVSEVVSTIGRVVSALQGATSPVIDDSVYCGDRAEEVLKGLEDRISTLKKSKLTLEPTQRSAIHSHLYQLFCNDQSIQLSKRLYSTTESNACNEDRKKEFLNLLIPEILKSLSDVEVDRGLMSSTFSVNPHIIKSLRSVILQVIANNLKLFRLKVATSVYDCSGESAYNNFHYIASGEIDVNETEALCVKYPSSINKKTSDMGYLPLHEAIRYRAQLLVDPKGGQAYCDNIIITLIMNGADPLQRKEVGTGIYSGRFGTQTAFEQLLSASLDTNDICDLAKLMAYKRCEYLKIDGSLVSSDPELQKALKLISHDSAKGISQLQIALMIIIRHQGPMLLLAGPASASDLLAVVEIPDSDDEEANNTTMVSSLAERHARGAPLMIECSQGDSQSPVPITVRSPVLTSPDSPRRQVQHGLFDSPLATQTSSRQSPTVSPQSL